MLIKTIKWTAKFILSGVAAFLIFCGISFFYYNTGRHTDNPSGATDYLWEGNTFYCQMREGFGYGVTDQDGFYNSFPGVTSDADILIMGSSHIEAAQVKPNETTAYLLNEHLSNSSVDMTAYSIGASSHNFFRCLSNLEDAVRYYSPEIVIIETDTMPTAEYQFKLVYENIMDEVVSYDDFRYDMQAVPFPKLIIQQYREYQVGVGKCDTSNGFDRISSLYGSCRNFMAEVAEIPTGVPTAAPDGGAVKSDYRTMVMGRVGEIADQYGVQIIIVFHPPMIIQKDGTAQPYVTERSSNSFFELCRNNGIIFVELGDVFKEAYDEAYIIPHGFCNTTFKGGHINADGHRMMAQQLFEVINDLQGEN